MVDRLMAKGHTVVGYNRTPARAKGLVERGMRLAGSPREVGEAADVTLVMVTDTAALEAVTDGPDGLLMGLGAGEVVIDMSTISPSASRAVAARVRGRGAEVIDAPVSGSVSTLEQGKLSIAVGGARATFDRAKPVLEDIGPTVTYVGENGHALSLKIAINLSVAVQMLAFAEGVLLAEKSGVDRGKAVEVMLRSVIASPMIQYRGPFVLEPPAEAWFSTAMMRKDVSLALEMGRQVDVPLPTTAVASEFLTAACTTGLADKDFALILRLLAHLSGVRVRHRRSRRNHLPRLPRTLGFPCTGEWSPSACSKITSTISTPAR